MRELTPTELELVMGKLAKFVGDNVKQLIERPDGETYVFRLMHKKIYYLHEDVERVAAMFKKEDVVGAGVCLGKMTHSGKFHLMITALPVLDPLCNFKVWLNSSGEQSFLFENNIVKSMVERMSESIPKNIGVVIYSSSGKAIGFGVTARSTVETERASPLDLVVYRYGDLGEYLRGEEKLG